MTWTVMPPPQYVHPPHVPVLEMRLDWAALHQICPGHDTLACSFSGKWKKEKTTYCFVVLPKATHLDVAKLRKHELAHCNGWPANHPGGHMEYVGGV